MLPPHATQAHPVAAGGTVAAAQGGTVSEALIDVITVHCFWGWCKHTERGLNGLSVHDAMEAHYSTVHAAELAALTSPITVAVIPGASWRLS